MAFALHGTLRRFAAARLPITADATGDAERAFGAVENPDVGRD